MYQHFRYGLSGSVLTALLISGCSGVNTQISEEITHPASHFPINANQSYFGVLPCDDCPSIETQLDLLANGAYFLTETYQDRSDGRSSVMGLWNIEDDRLVLDQGKKEERVYIASAAGGWRQTDKHTLDPIGWQPVSVNKQINGMLIYMADAPSIVECATGLRFPVVMTPEWIEIQRAYAHSRYIGGGYLHTQADVTMTWEKPEEGPARHHLRFGNLQRVVPGQTCGSPTALLANHEWDVVELDGFFSSDLDEMQARPYVRFSGQQLSGRTGCNVMAGTIHIKENTLSFGPIVSTRMFCQEAAEVEARFLQLMEEAKYSSLEGQQWTWYDKNMKRLMSFERKAIETPTP